MRANALWAPCKDMASVKKKNVGAASRGKLKNTLALYVFTAQGLDLAYRLSAHTRARIFAAHSLLARENETPREHPRACPFAALSELMPQTFSSYGGHVFISAAGIAVRAIAPLLVSKHSDPPVLVLDQRGQHVISLLSGHVGGGNALALRIAGIIGAKPVISTATDLEGLPGLDVLAQEQGLQMLNPEAVKTVSAALLAGEKVALVDPDNWLGLRGGEWAPLFFSPALPPPPHGPERLREALDWAVGREKDAVPGQERPGVIVTDCALPEPFAGQAHCLVLHPPSLCIGIGCRRGTQADDILAFIQREFADLGLAWACIASLASLDVKKEEQGLREAARNLGVPLLFFSAQLLAAQETPSSSAKALERFGLHSVCEPAALLAAKAEGRRRARLIAPKRKTSHITMAVARICR